MKKTMALILATTTVVSTILGSLPVFANDAVDEFVDGLMDGLVGEPSSENDSPENINLPDTIFPPAQYYDGHDVTISVTGASPTSDWSGDSLAIGIYIENKSSLNLGFNAHAYSINNVMTGNNIYDMDCDVAAGKKANTQLEISEDTLNSLGITEINYIDVLFWAYDNDEMFKNFETPIIRIKTEKDDSQDSIRYGNQLLDEDGVRIDYLGKQDSSYLFGIINNTGTYFDFDVANLSINDFTSSDTYFDLLSCELFDKSEYIISIQPDSDFLEMNGITDISKINFSIKYRPLGEFSAEKSTSVVEVNTSDIADNT